MAFGWPILTHNQMGACQNTGPPILASRLINGWFEASPKWRNPHVNWTQRDRVDHLFWPITSKLTVSNHWSLTIGDNHGELSSLVSWWPPPKVQWANRGTLATPKWWPRAGIGMWKALLLVMFTIFITHVGINLPQNGHSYAAWWGCLCCLIRVTPAGYQAFGNQ